MFANQLGFYYVDELLLFVRICARLYMLFYVSGAEMDNFCLFQTKYVLYVRLFDVDVLVHWYNKSNEFIFSSILQLSFYSNQISIIKLWKENETFDSKKKLVIINPRVNTFRWKHKRHSYKIINCFIIPHYTYVHLKMIVDKQTNNTLPNYGRAVLRKGCHNVIIFVVFSKRIIIAQ